MNQLVPIIILVIVLVLVAYYLGVEAYALPLILEARIELYPSAFLTMVLATQAYLAILFPTLVTLAAGDISTLVTATDFHIFDGVTVADEYNPNGVTVPDVDVIPAGPRVRSNITLAALKEVVVPNDVGVDDQTTQGCVLGV